MNTQPDPEQIKQLLNRSLSNLEQPVLDRLRDARTQALLHFETRAHAPAYAHAWASHGVVPLTQPKSYYWIATLLLAACLISGYSYWHHVVESEVSDVDIAILTDELPMDVYVE